MNPKVEEIIAVGKWATFVDHLKSNRIEYLLVIGILHLLGLTDKAYSHVSGVCL